MKPQCTTTAECLRELARVMDQFEIDFPALAMRSRFIKYNRGGYDGLFSIPDFLKPEDWQFAIAEVEGKPVFIGDNLFYGELLITVSGFVNTYHVKAECGIYQCASLYWNPPRPKTVMVEMLVKDAEWFVEAYDPECGGKTGNVSFAVKKALEELK